VGVDGRRDEGAHLLAGDRAGQNHQAGGLQAVRGVLMHVVARLGQGVGQGVLGLVPQGAEPGPDRRALADQLVEALESGRVGVGDERVQQRAGDRVEGGLPGGSVADGGDERVQDVRLVAEDQFFLRADVGEQRLDRDVGRVGDLRDGHVLEAALTEQPRGHLEDGGAGHSLLALAQAGGGDVSGPRPRHWGLG